MSYHDRTNGDLKYAYARPIIACEGWIGIQVAQTVHLLSVRPNPVRRGLGVACLLGVDGGPAVVSLKVCDSLGRLVAAPLQGPLTAGTHLARWDLLTSAGRAVDPGICYLRLESEGDRTRDVRRLVVVR